MKKKHILSMLTIFIVLFLFSTSSSYALPVWWDIANYKKNGSFSVNSPGSTDIDLQNHYISWQCKELYLVLNWTGDGQVDDVDFSWNQPVGKGARYHDNDVWFPGNLVSSSPGHAEYNYKINPQPEWDWARIFYTAQDLTVTYDFRSRCSTACNPVPEPGTLLVLVSGVLSMIGVARKYNS